MTNFTKYGLVMTRTPCRVAALAGGIISIGHLGLRIHAPVHLLTYLILKQKTYCDWPLI